MRNLADSAPEAPGPGTGSAAWVVGVDGGGTSSRAIILDLSGEEMGRGEGPPALLDPADPSAAAGAIEATVRGAAEDAGAALPLGTLWAGLAGAGRAGEREEMEVALRSRTLARWVKVGKDVEGAYRDAFGSGPGLLLVVGTGSMVWGRDAEGREIRVGGWGGILGDEGSGYWLGLRGLQAVARAADGRSPPTTLTGTLLATLNLDDPQGLISWTATATKGAIAALAPRVLDAAEAEDPVAADILEEGLNALLRHLEVAGSRWPASERPVPLALAGGLMGEGSALRQGLEPLVVGVGGRLVSRSIVPARGAAELALEMARGR